MPVQHVKLPGRYCAVLSPLPRLPRPGFALRFADEKVPRTSTGKGDFKYTDIATATMTAPARERTAQVRIHLKTKNEDIQLPETGPILVSTGKA